LLLLLLLLIQGHIDSSEHGRQGRWCVSSSWAHILANIPQ
jgi:hypothetical protein